MVVVRIAHGRYSSAAVGSIRKRLGEMRVCS